ncbi:MAG: sigma-54 dependent transcriptional regulator [Vicinamibacterales bacterium]|nr:sigma-54 dependent transcriptional regulator [Vicinamibacterales bacterium]
MASTPAHILFVDDEPALRELTAERLGEQGFEVVQAENGERGLALLDEFAFDVVITDLRMPGVDGLTLLDAAVERYPGIIVIVVTGYGTVKDAVGAIRRGATDFIAKPFQFEELKHVLQKALDRRRLAQENAYLRSQLEQRFGVGGIIGKSRPMQALFELLETVAPSSSTMLVHGETGTGKEVVARAIHQMSPRRAQRFVAINCSAIPETLLEAELFGHARGAFTGAVGMRQGRLEQAHKGTLFLDEIGTMSPALQAKLLRALQEREFERLGDNQTIKVDVRVIAATNSDLTAMVKAGTFREDLYYRLNVITITLPPLRDRREDIPLLVQHFLTKLAGDRPVAEPRQFAQGAMRALMAAEWPGNVRQLENAVERAVAMSGGRSLLDVTDLPPEVRAADEPSAIPSVVFPEEGIQLGDYLATLERTLIQQSLERTGGNRHKAATLLGLKRTTLVEKLKRLEKPPGT